MVDFIRDFFTRNHIKVKEQSFILKASIFFNKGEPNVNPISYSKILIEPNILLVLKSQYRGYYIFEINTNNRVTKVFYPKDLFSFLPKIKIQ